MDYPVKLNMNEWYEIVFAHAELDADIKKKINFVIDRVGYSNLSLQSQINCDFYKENEGAPEWVEFKCSRETFEEIQHQLGLRQCWSY